MVLWSFDGSQLQIIDQRLLDNNQTALCLKLEILPQPRFSEKVKFATEHVQDQGKTFLQFWTYDFKDHDLFLDKSILFDSPISILYGCTLTNYLYVQRSSERKELLMYNDQAELVDKIDQNEEIMTA